MKKHVFGRKTNGQFKRSGSDGNKVVKVNLHGRDINEMTKKELDDYLEKSGLYALYQNGIYIVVGEAVYRTVKQEEWREAKRQQRNQKANELSREKTTDSNVKVSAHNETLVGSFYDSLEFLAETVDSPEDILIKREKLEELYAVLETLSDRDKEIIKLFSNKYTDTRIGEKIGMSQRGVYGRKIVLLAKLKKLLEKML